MIDTSGWKVLQIMPADDWAVSVQDAATRHTTRHRLCGWALVDEEASGRRFVTGLIPDGELEGECGFAADIEGFQGFVFDPNPLS
ncbi:MAG: hypothetical protein K8F93_17970 [Burkholderiales bacterium]|jgi:hypothetical protein|nr:hypothetical protein [Burkholderiales bacterium]